jgi:RNA polymerase sigma-70 factor (ECF subfamily)
VAIAGLGRRLIEAKKMTAEGSLSPVSLVSARVPAAPAAADRLRALVDQHFAFIARSVRRLGVLEADIDDAAQQIFLVAANKIGSLAPGSEKAFLYGIAVRVASDARRTRRRRAAREGVAAGIPMAPADTPEEIAHDRQARAMLDDILDAMPVAVRTVFTLFELEELTMAEIAALLGTPPGWVASRLRRGRGIFQQEAARRRAMASPGNPTGSQR